MAHYRGTIPSARTPEAAFAYMADFSNAAEWDPSVNRAKRLDEAPLGVGSQFELALTFAGRPIELIYDVTEYDEAARRIVLQANNGATTSIDTITVADDAAVTYDARLELTGLAKVIDPIMQLVFKRIGDNASAELGRILSRA
ncbi:MAG: SRPBCC family protein [Solirubrobacteraceae bacterium]|nr:SRPBCC family protein [Solirubrobacteraceae bacterium]